ncbi:hypothetical protein RYR28_001619 [Edwardsiella piscicida]|uniref:hypothetical protein n=1 Tax=Edwardsiella piscicida TaxID=1263550 RepID=UPI00084BE03A|nr:hypothetical protein [Edwardsiella piscicida]AOP44565.1 hypothetical protein A9797_16845 [Edwardsiella piscicida]EKS7767799.1 hypothetical protein [Edwardsiella piscicida]EKS7814181.1 hypothetical protein [Edwardsiella piscicida]ELM3722868.1 hypothetical protein [Edwardsiella piscicida]UCQ21022.1 hypothetical protein DCE66_16645 [Edwardsiella piscicida]
MSHDLFEPEMKITLDDNSAIHAFFKKFSRVGPEIRDNIYRELPQIIQRRPHKIKAAWGLKHQGLTILEYKVALKPQSFRAAYIQRGEEVRVIFISDILIKRDFVKALAATSLVD